MITELTSSFKNALTAAGLVEIAMTLAGIATFGLILLFAWRMLRGWFGYRGTRLVRCPETRNTVAVRLDAWRAAVTAAGDRPVLKLTSCTRWPERQDCGQECICEIENSPTCTLLQNIVAKWYEGRQCYYCHAHVGGLGAFDGEPALLAPDGRTFQWSQIPPEKIPEALETHRPLCWNCHVASCFRREWPGMAIDREWPPDGPCGERCAAESAHKKTPA
jgi:hypothetical protein